jgi:hypothetical protein
MPRKCVVIVAAGGLQVTHSDSLVNPRFDIWSYGETPYEAGVLDGMVYDVLQAIERRSIAGVLLHSAGLSGGPLGLRDPDTDWPYKVRSINVTADERIVI